MKQDIEYAALVMGFDDAEWDAVTETIITVHLPGMRCFWNPLRNDGDSRRLEIACNKWTNTNGAEADTICDAHWNYVESWGECDPQAIRAAVFALAVAIGKVIDEGNDNAG
jgi:hypothetical protein